METSQSWFKEAALSPTAHSDRRQSRFALPPCAAVMRPMSGVKPSSFTPKLQAPDGETHLQLFYREAATLSASFCLFHFAPGQQRRHQSGRMNSIKQVPTRVRSRRVEANLGAEREHFEKQQVNAQKGGWSAWLCFCEKNSAVLTSAAAWLRHRVCVCARACVAGTDRTPRAPFTVRKLGLQHLN